MLYEVDTSMLVAIAFKTQLRSQHPPASLPTTPTALLPRKEISPLSGAFSYPENILMS